METVNAQIHYSTNRHERPVTQILSESKGFSLSENAYFLIVLETETEFTEDTHIWLGDFRFPLERLSHDIGSDTFKYSPAIDAIFSASEREMFSSGFDTVYGHKRLYKLFLNYFGNCTIEIEHRNGEKETYFVVGSIDVYSEKIHEISGLLDYLFEKEYYFWNIVSLTKVTADEHEKITDNIFWKLCSVKEICKMFTEDFLDQITFSKITKLIPANKIRRWSEMEVISDSSLLWFIENENALSLTTIADENHFLVLNKPYKSDIVFSEALVESTDVYENQLVHWFVNDVYQFLHETKGAVRKKYKEYIEKNDFLKYGIYSSFFKRMMTFADELENEIENIKGVLKVHIPVSIEQVDGIQDQRLHSKPHYRNLYFYLIKWFESRQVQYYPDVLFSGLKHVSKLYEVFCLFKIFDSLLLDLHFTTVESSVLYQATGLQFDPFSIKDVEMPSRFDFEKGDIRLSVYYDTLPTNLTTVSRTGGRGLRPDFVFELTNNGVVSYYIMDAKYKTITNIETFDYNELTLKYLHGVGPVNGGRFNVQALLVFNPIAQGGVSFYHRNHYSPNGHSTILPVIGRVEVSVKQSTTGTLSRVLEQLITVSKRQSGITFIK